MHQRKLNNDREFSKISRKNDAMRRICECGATCDEYDSTPRGGQQIKLVF